MKAPDLRAIAITSSARAVLLSANEVVQGLAEALNSNDHLTVAGAMMGLEDHVRAMLAQIEAAKAINRLSYRVNAGDLLKVKS